MRCGGVSSSAAATARTGGASAAGPASTTTSTRRGCACRGRTRWRRAHRRLSLTSRCDHCRSHRAAPSGTCACAARRWRRRGQQACDGRHVIDVRDEDARRVVLEHDVVPPVQLPEILEARDVSSV